jgi:outer membrane beta-barrel protein
VNKIILTTLLLIIGASPAWSQKSTSTESDRVDLKQLEETYWSAKDTDFNVVQNRTYSKAKRFFLSGTYGPLVNDPYSYARLMNLSLGYYTSERWGFEIANESGQLTNNQSTDVFINNNSFAPNFNRFQSYTSLNVIIVPFYAKMSFFDRKILYFDMQFAAGLGTLTYEQQRNSNAKPETKSAVGFNFDITQQIFFSNNFAVRFDIKNKWSKQEQVSFQSGVKVKDLTNQDTSMLLGLTYFH